MIGRDSSDGGRILTFNAGSSSLKLGLFDAEARQQIAAVSMDGEEAETALRGEVGAIDGLLRREGIERDRVRAVGHRVVHGGTRQVRSVLLNAAVERDVEELAPLAPNHNPAALAVIRAVRALLPGVPQVAAFDTAFHATLPPGAHVYPLPYRWYAEWGIRRFGFHGLSHAYCAGRTAELLGRSIEELRVVTCHLGSGCSLAAIAAGRSVATTMGFTPLDGLAMGRRPGALDPGILLHLLATNRLSLDELDDALTHDSGLKGLAGGSGDLREILAARAAGDERAALAYDVFIARLREGIGAMAATLGALDALVFTAGIGEHQPVVRADACATLGVLGVTLDEPANETATPDAVVSSAESRVAVLVVKTREDLIVARETRRVVAETRP
jgi:acetate kinase